MKDYINNHYGVCNKKDKCSCLRSGEDWLGQLCKDWVPMSEFLGKEINNMQDLAANMKEIREKTEEFWKS